jgi:signal peptidase I
VSRPAASATGAVSRPRVAITPVSDAGPGRVRRAVRRLRNAVLIALLVAIVLGLLVVRPLVAEPFRIPSASMAPTIQAGDHVLADKRAYDDALPARGDLAVFHAPTPSRDVTLKRVIALPGDRVAIEDGVLVLNGRRVREPYADPSAIDSEFFGPVTVRPGTVFVLGDNRADSIDSRDFGAVPADRLIGRVAARIWPPTRWGTTG